MTDVRKLMCVVELTVDDAVMVGKTLQSLAHTRLADASAAERLERVGRAMMAARADAELRAHGVDISSALAGLAAAGYAPDDVAAAGQTLSAWRASALEARARVAELEARLAANAPLVGAAFAWGLANDALVEAARVARECLDECARVRTADVNGDVATADRRHDNATFWRSTCQASEGRAVAAVLAATRALVPRVVKLPSIVRIVRGAACVTGEARETGGWRFACQVCDANWSQPDSSDATAIAHMQLKHREDTEATPSAP